MLGFFTVQLCSRLLDIQERREEGKGGEGIREREVKEGSIEERRDG
jgi:hypothetical protein